MQKQEIHVPWYERAFASISSTAAVFDRSPDWVRARIAEERLEVRRLTRGGPLVVTVASICRLINEAEPAAPPKPARRPALRLITNNGVRIAP